MYKLLFFFVFVSISSNSFSQIKWLTFEEVEIAQKEKPKKIFFDIYTSWCGWCKKMDKGTLTDSVVINYINEHFYAVKFDAETREEITFLGDNYTLEKVGARSYNELAVDLMQRKISFPTTAYLDENFSLLTSVGSYLTADKLLQILRYFGENYHLDMKWDEYEKFYSENY